MLRGLELFVLEAAQFFAYMVAAQLAEKYTFSQGLKKAKLLYNNSIKLPKINADFIDLA